LLLSRGVPMLCAGDEVLRTQGGNNNAYCQGNELSWFDWSRVESEREMLDFTRGMIAFRRQHRSLTVNHFYQGRVIPDRGIADIAWHGTRLQQPPWDDANARVLAFTIAGMEEGETDLHAILNMSDAVIEVDLPTLPGRAWRVAVDTAQAPPHDIVEPARQVPLTAARYRLSSRSVVVLEARVAQESTAVRPTAGAAVR
ncbi:MAG: glycogen debranching enzyme, partial [Gammaproteobacteria bacterium]|nr:glycogen debranching enzyme [Gammaproteobacteria bacterium]